MFRLGSSEAVSDWICEIKNRFYYINKKMNYICGNFMTKILIVNNKKNLFVLRSMI